MALHAQPCYAVILCAKTRERGRGGGAGGQDEEGMRGGEGVRNHAGGDPTTAAGQVIPPNPYRKLNRSNRQWLIGCSSSKSITASSRIGVEMQQSWRSHCGGGSRWQT